MVKFPRRDTKATRILAKNQHKYSREIIYFVNRNSAELSNIRHHFRKLSVSNFFLSFKVIGIGIDWDHKTFILSK